MANTRIISLAEVSASVATLTLNSSSTIGINDFIRVSTNNSAYNGIFNVSACPSSTQISYPLNSANLSPAAVSGSVEYIAYDEQGRPAYMYDVETNKWIEIAGKIDTGKNYTFNGYNTFNSTTVFRGPTIINSASGAVGLEINAASGQSSNLIQVDDSSGLTTFRIDGQGAINSNSASISVLNSSDTYSQLLNSVNIYSQSINSNLATISSVNASNLFVTNSTISNISSSSISSSSASISSLLVSASLSTASVGMTSKTATAGIFPLPVNAEGFLSIYIDGQLFKIPYYKA